MTDRVFPASKPATNGAVAAANGNGAATNPAPAKSHLYNPTSRAPYRPQPHHRRHRRSGRSFCCCCCFWTILIVLILALIVSVCGIALYILYRPHRPEFSVPFLRIHRLNLTTASDSSSSHLSTLLNMTIFIKNPNSHITFFYDPFVLTALSDSNDVQLGNGSLPGFTLQKKNETTFKGVLISGSNELDAESVTALRSDLRKKNGVGLMIQMDTKVKVKIGGFKAKKIGIRVKCDKIKGVVPKGKTPSVAVTTKSKCKVDLRIKIWKWTF
ncbi:hypothetical protein HS088_TW09G01257 [Tripterygium wilfordii]|uniref:Late embryogenesis abundant protein LEA-2 subgroup domain-containing protein n=1 Tax=Tripterygium wilfordii TaxID=458696 RepID=A0A7J7DA13_TRIWF|nr:NDR1/HIN1-like protein 13 [Tripterygium wilfordii]KAF5743192.1 hypothetical protein HS088_TW09G01257 [Tripterygium wilfordii]